MKCRIVNQPSDSAILACNIADEEKPHLEMIAESLAAKMIFAQKSDYCMAVADVIDGKKNDAKHIETDFSEPMIIMHRVNLDKALRLFREKGIKTELKAVTTPTNLNWDFTKIYQHLCEERNALNSGAHKA